MIQTLHISLLGDFSLVADETAISAIMLPRVQSLLAYLLLHRNAPQNRSHLAFLLWPDSTESQAHTNLRQLLYHLRQALPDANQFIRADKQSLQWLPAHAGIHFTLDIQELEQSLAQAEQEQNTHTQRLALEQVLRLYRGDLLPGCYEEWMLPERDRLRELFLKAAEHLLALVEQEQDYSAAISVAQRLLRADPLDESTYRHLMRLYALRGEPAAALRTYHACAQRLEHELGAGPSAMTQAVYASLKQTAEAGISPETKVETVSIQRSETPLQGRKAEWQQFQQAWNKATGGKTGRSQMVLLSGEAGIGKTRLAKECVEWVSRRGITTAHARCYATLEHLAYAPITAWLRSDPFLATFSTLDPTALIEIARLMPEVLASHPNLSPPVAMTEGWQRQFFFAALVRVILSVRQPLLLWIDDLHWCDQETLEWIQYLSHFAPEARLLVIGTVRAEETSPEHPLMTLLGDLQRDGLVTEIPLGPLTLTETASLAEYMLGSQIDPARREGFYQETEGNPFFVVEMIQAEVAGKDANLHTISPGSLPLLTKTASPLPSTVQALLAARLIRLSPRARAVANVAAVIGREFSFAVLARACKEREEDVLQGLDELWQQRIIRDRDAEVTQAYDFSHDKLREQLIASLSPAHRQLLHQRVADACKIVYADEEDNVCGQIAAHYEQAGLLAQAIPFYQRAGEVAARMYAHAEALHAFRKAATLLEKHQPGQNVHWKIAAQVYISLGDMSVETGSYEEARRAYQQAIASAPREAHVWQARGQWKIATTWVYSFASNHDPSYHQSIQAFEQAERILTQVTDPANPAWRAEWLAIQFARVWRGSADDIEAAIQKARPVVEQHGTPEQCKLLAEAVGVHNATRNHFVIPAHRVAAWRASIMELEPTANEAQHGMDLALFGIGLLSAAQFDEAEEQLRLALRIGERTGNAWLQRNCLTFLPFALRARGQLEEVRRILTRAESINIALNNQILTGQRAWVAWREGNLALAESYGHEAIQEEQGSQIRPNPFFWTGRWPLIGVAIAQGQITTAVEHARLLFTPTQQPPREPLGTLLINTLQAWDAGEQEKASDLLQQVQPLAEQMGYL